MSSYEIGMEVNKVIEKILSEMVVRNSFDRLVVDKISGQMGPETVVSLFKLYLKGKEEK